MILLLIFGLAAIAVSFILEKPTLGFALIIGITLLIILNPPSDLYYDYSNVKIIDSGYHLVCYKATGGFFRPYLEVDCDKPSVELTKNISTSFYYYNTNTKKSCENRMDCADVRKATWWEKYG